LEPRLPLPFERVDRYDVLFELGRGGMAAVFAARRSGPSGFGKLVALKLLLPHLASDQRFRELFLNEARLAAQLEHPNVVTVFDLAEHQGLPMLVMELVRGQSLRRALERLTAPALRLRFGIQVAVGVAEGLHAAHTAIATDGSALGIVHRDVSPENVLIGYDGRIKLADFGIAKARASSPATLTGELRGKLGYLAPEQITRSQPVGAKSDLWALGVMLHEVAYGNHPFVGETDAETLWNVINRSIRLPEQEPVPEALRELIRRCLTRETAERPESAQEVRRALGEIAESLGRQALAGARLPAADSDVGATLSGAFEQERAAEAERLVATGADNRTFTAEQASAEQASAERPSRRSLALRGVRAWLLLGVAVLLGSGLAWALRGEPRPLPEVVRPASVGAPAASVAAASSSLGWSVTARSVPSAQEPTVGAIITASSKPRAQPKSAVSARRSDPLLDNPYP